MENQTVNEGKTAAIIAYFTIIGTLVAFIMNNSKKNSFTSFHIRQFFGIFIMGMINKYLVFDMLGKFIGGIVFLFLVILWFIGFIGAIKGEEKQVPVVGEYFQRWFNGI
ncbi:DUF4870 domain-containing protein [Polaribacter porphyrae]|uniref:Import component protein n=1 Tax=Polaribacter porphyrae TaxID=1137780 RepID=A0A2S7WKI3_9FLAO|nr:hypothetical protein [Polaribacter porphyrae]PQJ78110.1 hypothetical protein BTO18_02385 [Polaribacter porphyrae]